jgi:hypothetical protein
MEITIFISCSVIIGFPGNTWKLTEYVEYGLKGQSHEKVYEFLTWEDSFSLN